MTGVGGDLKPRRPTAAARPPAGGQGLALRLGIVVLLIGALVWVSRSCAGSRVEPPTGDFSLLLIVADGPRARVDVAGGRMKIVLRGGTESGELDAAAGPRAGTVFDMAVTHADLERIVDAVGGLLINIPAPIEYKSEESLPVRIDPGMRRLDADRVRRYLGRPGSPPAAALRAVVMGMAARVGELEVQGVDLARLLSAAIAGDALGEDQRNPQRLAGLFLAARGMGPTDVTIDWGSSVSAAPAGSSPAAAGDASAENTAPPSMTRPLRLRILNGTGRPGLAARAAARFPSGRFEISETANADRFGYARTEVRGGELSGGNEAVIREVIGVLGVGRFQAGAPRPGVDVEIVLGNDARGL